MPHPRPADRPRCKPFDDGRLVWALAIGGVLVFDVCLVEGGHLSLSCHAGRHPRWALLGLVVGFIHFNTGNARGWVRGYRKGSR